MSNVCIVLTSMEHKDTCREMGCRNMLTENSLETGYRLQEYLTKNLITQESYDQLMASPENRVCSCSFTSSQSGGCTYCLPKTSLSDWNQYIDPLIYSSKKIFGPTPQRWSDHDLEECKQYTRHANEQIKWECAALCLWGLKQPVYPFFAQCARGANQKNVLIDLTNMRNPDTRYLKWLVDEQLISINHSRWG